MKISLFCMWTLSVILSYFSKLCWYLRRIKIGAWQSPQELILQNYTLKQMDSWFFNAQHLFLLILLRAYQLFPGKAAFTLVGGGQSMEEPHPFPGQGLCLWLRRKESDSFLWSLSQEQKTFVVNSSWWWWPEETLLLLWAGRAPQTTPSCFLRTFLWDSVRCSVSFQWIQLS